MACKAFIKGKPKFKGNHTILPMGIHKSLQKTIGQSDIQKKNAFRWAFLEKSIH